MTNPCGFLVNHCRYYLQCSCISETRRFAAEKSCSHISVAFYFFLWLNLIHTLHQVYNVWQQQDPHQCCCYSRIIQVTHIAELLVVDMSQRRMPNKSVEQSSHLFGFPVNTGQMGGCHLCKQLEDSLAVVFVPHNMANSESMVALLRSKHHVFSNIFCEKN